MRATDILMAEHRNIERVLGALEAAVRKVDGGEAIRPEFFSDAAEFLRGYADGCHHQKEEEILFTALVERGMPKHQGPVGVMLAEHEQARSFTRVMREGAARWAEGDEDAKSQVTNAARGYAVLLRDHIAKEDNVLFPMAESTLSPDGRDAVSTSVEKIDRDQEESGLHKQFLDLAEKLAQEVS